MSKGRWRTGTGRTLDITDMTTGHLKNAAAFLQRRLDRGAYRRSHMCMVSDPRDGVCSDCELQFDRKCYWQDKIAEFKAELKTRVVLSTQVLVDRLREYVNPYSRLGVEPFTLGGAHRAKPRKFAEFADRGPAYHAGRVRAILDKIENGWTMDAIWVSAGTPQASVAIIDNGHHRFVAALLLNLDTIAVEYSGRLDVLEYLTGERESIPTEVAT